MTSTPAAELIGACVPAGDRFRLQQTDLRIRGGVVTAVIGRNGSGKSTLLGVLSGELAPGSGSARIGGHDVRELSTVELARRRALLTQETQVSFGFTVAETEKFQAPLKGPHFFAVRLRFGPPMSGELMFPRAFGVPRA